MSINYIYLQLPLAPTNPCPLIISICRCHLPLTTHGLTRPLLALLPLFITLQLSLASAIHDLTLSFLTLQLFIVRTNTRSNVAFNSHCSCHLPLQIGSRAQRSENKNRRAAKCGGGCQYKGSRFVWFTKEFASYFHILPTCMYAFPFLYVIRRRRRATPYFFSTSCYLIRMT